MRRLRILVGFLMGASIWTPTASGALRLTLSSGGRTVVINDGSALDAARAAGTIGFYGTIEGWGLHMSLSRVGSEFLLALNAAESMTGGLAALNISLSGDNFTGGPGMGFDARIRGTVGAEHTLAYQGYFNPSNMLDATENAIGALMDSTQGTGLNGNRLAGMAPAGSYSLSQTVVLTASGEGRSSAFAGIFGAAMADPVAATPEPASVILLSGVALFAVHRLRGTGRAQSRSV